MKILDRHIRDSVFGMCLIVGLALAGITGFITLVEELDDLGKGQYTLELVALVSMLKLSEVLYQMLPLIALLGAMMGLGNLAAAGELVVMQAAGVSVLRIAGAAMKAGLLVGLLGLAFGEFVVPRAVSLAEHIEDQARHGEDVRRGGAVWLREGPHYIRFGDLPDQGNPRDVQSLTINQNDHRLVRTSHMGEVTYRQGRWLARDIRLTEVGYGRVRMQHKDEGEWLVDLKPEVLRLFALKSDSLSLAGLWQYIRYLKSNGLDASAPQYAFWGKLAVPATIMVMILMAVPFALGPLRDTGAGQRLFIGVMLGIVFYLLNEVASSLGQVYGWPAVIAAFTPTVLLTGLAGWRLLRVARPV